MSKVFPTMVGGHPVDGDRLREICERFGVVELTLFGSEARGQARPDSDVDLCYVLAPGGMSGFALNRLEDELSALFGRRVDLVAKKSLHPLLRDHVLGEARRLYAA